MPVCSADHGGPYHAAVEAFREHEYPMLKDNTYLDHAGTTLYSRALVDRFAADMLAGLLGNPHAASASSQAASALVEDVRLRALQFVGADPAEFDLVFVANATAGIKLVAEALRARPCRSDGDGDGDSDEDGDGDGGSRRGFAYAYHEASHTSLVGVREEARQAVCVSSAAVDAWAAGGDGPFDADDADDSDILFAYPAQSNMDGRRFPRAWAHLVREQADRPGQRQRQRRRRRRHVWTLLDAAAYASTAPLDLSDAARAPDFTVLSFYKIFGFPDLGALIVRRPAEPAFAARRYFGGGTVDVVVCAARPAWRHEQWHAPKTTAALHDRLEDGTLPVHSIAALGAALDTHAALYGSMARVAAHAGFLADRLYAGLAGQRHANGAPVCAIYSPARTAGGCADGNADTDADADADAGPVLALNLRNARGAWVSLTEFDKLATLQRFHVRTGGVCNPGGVAAALGLAPWEMRRNFSHGVRCGADGGADDIVAGKPTGVVRVSLGAMSTVADVDRFVAFVDEFYREAGQPEADPRPLSLSPSPRLAAATPLVVAGICVYPIKSCGTFVVPPGTRWEVRPEGLAWDREWCLVHRGTRRALSQKQHPQMVLLRPVLDFARGVLRVSFAGRPAEEVCVPLSSNPAVYAGPDGATALPPPARASRVCGEEVAAQVYTSAAVNAFFSDALGVPCLLARFPPGGQGASMRHAKAHLQRHQDGGGGALPASLPSPPDSDSEPAAARADRADRADRRILLANESPILAIHLASLRQLNADIRQRTPAAAPVSPAVFRANIVLDSQPPSSSSSSSAAPPYAEDAWTHVRIGAQAFRMLGACRRCHMVCIDQETGAKSDEPFVTLAKTRRFDGKVFFGTHMAHEPAEAAVTPARQHPTIAVDDAAEAA